MDSSLKILSILASTLSLLLLIISISQARILPNDLIDDVCSHAKTPKFCLDVLRSNPGAAKANLTELGQIVIDLTQANGTDTLNYVKDLAQKASDPKLKGVYESCSENYDEAISDLNDAEQSLKTGDYGGIGNYASGALDQADTCNEDAKGPGPAELSQRNENFEGLCDIILVVGNLLRGGGATGEIHNN